MMLHCACRNVYPSSGQFRINIHLVKQNIQLSTVQYTAHTLYLYLLLHHVRYCAGATLFVRRVQAQDSPRQRAQRRGHVRPAQIQGTISTGATYILRSKRKEVYECLRYCMSEFKSVSISPLLFSAQTLLSLFIKLSPPLPICF